LLSSGGGVKKKQTKKGKVSSKGGGGLSNKGAGGLGKESDIAHRGAIAGLQNGGEEQDREDVHARGVITEQKDGT